MAGLKGMTQAAKAAKADNPTEAVVTKKTSSKRKKDEIAESTSNKKKVEVSTTATKAASVAPATKSQKAQSDQLSKIISVTALCCAAIAVGYTSWVDKKLGELPEFSMEIAASVVPTQTGPDIVLSMQDDALLLVSMNLLDRVLETSQPYAYELAVAMKATNDISDISLILDRLIDTAESGVPTNSELTDAWKTYVSSQLDLTSRLGNVVNQMLGFDEQSQNNIEVLLSADENIRMGNLTAAAATLSTLEGDINGVISPWIDVANKRAEVDASRTELQRLTYLSILADPK